jgi:protease-4
MAGSSGYLVGCALDLFYASRPNDIVGSIGTYIPYQNWDGYFEKMGIKQEDIYAKQSSEKNLEGRQAAEGNFKLLQKMADDEAARFISYVKDRRPNLNLEAGDPFKGKIFSATDALSIGLIDGIGDLKAAVTALKSSDTTQNTTPRTTMSKLFGYAKVAALTALATSVTAETIQAANEELESQLGLKDFQLISKTEFESMIEAANKAPDTKALDDKISALNTQVTNLTEERNGWKTKAEEYGAKNGDEKTTIKTQGDKPADEGESQNSADSVIAGLEHNKALEGTWFATLGQAETK